MRPFIAILLVFAFTSSCKDDGSGLFDSLRNCCDNPHLEELVGQGKIFLPNVFSPNNDGINDLLYVQASANIETVVSFVVNRDIQAAFFTTSDVPPNDPSVGWDGTDQFGNPLQGQVAVEVTVRDVNGVEATFNHQVCVISDSPIPCFDQLESCAWPSQHSGQGGFDASLAPGEMCE